ncbi:hypothetical protein [Gilliamella sp. Bif1-4]|uniref:hypothetical protein n=1 Tax=Gilliamella sp. Bif1-4 TaxID=3120233 RepID=UPI00080E4478|nr:hypothetical protein [Gilliamella apicola]OCG40846.1 hypothetical protein A9G25_06810 [Gilliamella apicola]
MLKVNDVVIFKNIFSKLAGRVSKLKKDKGGSVIGCEIVSVDRTFMMSTYHVSIDDVIDIVNENIL